MNKSLSSKWNQLIHQFPLNNPNPVLLVDITGKVIFANEAAQPIIQAWETDNLKQSFCPFHSEIEFAISKGILIEVEKSIDEHLYAFSIQSSPCGTGAYLYVQEISQKREQEKTLTLYSEIIKHLAEGVFMVQFDNGRLVYCNPNFALQFGYNEKELLGKKAKDLLSHPTLLSSQTFESIIEILRLKGQWQGELQAVKKDGRIFWNYFILSTLKHVDYGEVILGTQIDITTRKQAEIAFLEEQQKAQRYLDIARVIMVVVGADERVHLINKMGCEVLGYSEEEILGKNWFDNFLPERGREEVKALSRKIIAGEVEPLNDYENAIVSADGEEHLIAWHNTTLYDNDGNITGHLSSGSDITLERQTQALVQQFKTFADSMYDALFIFSPIDWKFSYANQQAINQCGFSYDEILKMTPLDIKPKFNEKSFNDLLTSLKQNDDQSITFETVHSHKNGILTPVEVTLQYIAPANEPARYNAIARDISVRKSMEKKLNLADKIMEGTSDAILVTDLQGNILDVNAAFTNITGYQRNEVIGQNPRIAKSGYQDAAFYKNMWEQILNKGHWSGEIWDRKANGELYPKLLTINTIYDDEGEPQYYTGIFTDISQMKNVEQRLHNLAYYDALTKLPNRSLFHDRLSHELAIAKRQHNSFALLYVDLDKFKDVNDTLGHNAGDTLLQTAADRISEKLRESDTVARIGGDEFAILLSNSPSEEMAGNIAQQIIGEMQRQFSIQKSPVFIGATIGIAFYPKDGETEEDLYKYADLAMYQAKEAGRNCFRFFTEQMNEKVSRHIQLVNDLHKALEKEEFILFYQPKYTLTDRSLAGFEALIRWQHSDKGLIPPGDFISVAEDSHLIVFIGDWVIREAFKQLQQWHSDGKTHLSMAINIASKQLFEVNFVERVQNYLNSYQVNPKAVEFEITESMLMDDIEKAVQVLMQLGELGIKIAIDDFGTGYSSLAYLKQFPIDTLKIDQSFIRFLEPGSQDAAIVDTIISMAKNLNKIVVAEGIENRSQEQYLRQQGCHLGQGYGYAKPMSSSDSNAYLKM